MDLLTDVLSFFHLHTVLLFNAELTVPTKFIKTLVYSSIVIILWKKIMTRYKICLKSNGIVHILQCERNRPQWVLDTEPGDHSASLKRGPVVFASLSAQEETRVVARQIVGVSP